jgi:hypothetical protein
VLEELALRAGEAARTHRAAEQYQRLFEQNLPEESPPSRSQNRRGARGNSPRGAMRGAPPRRSRPRGNAMRQGVTERPHVCTGLRFNIPCRICGKMPHETDAFARLFG